MKKLLSIFLLLSYFVTFSQNEFPKMPQNATEIHFTYQRKSNTFLDDKGFYADSLLCQLYFPNLKYLKVENPKAYYLNSFIPLSSFDIESKRALVGFLYHNNESYSGSYNIKKNITIIKAERNDSEVRASLKKYLKENYYFFKYNIKIDYKINTLVVEYPTIIHTSDFSKIQRRVTWKSEFKGSFQQLQEKFLETNIIEVDQNLSKFISLGNVFENNDFGVLKIESLLSTVNLLSVSYK